MSLRIGFVFVIVMAIIPVIGWLVTMLVVLFGLGAELAARRQFCVTARRQEML
jgi:hypothetical protein